ncbi:MAG: OsmC family protein [Planctomycetota bacterium]
MLERTATVRWEGGLRDGRGHIRLGGGAWEGPYSFTSRFEDGPGTNPEELLGAAHAGCFSMAFAKALADAGHPPRQIRTTARVRLEQAAGGFAITRIGLRTEVEVPGLSDQEFQRIAEAAKVGCPVSKALASTRIELEALRTG